MKNLNFYKKREMDTQKKVFEYLTSSFLLNNRTWDYFINWQKVYQNTNDVKKELNILNSLCKSKNFDSDLRNILKKYPEVTKAFPTLIGIRDKQISIMNSSSLPEFNYIEFDFNEPPKTKEEIENFVLFFEKSGLKNLILNSGLTNLADYAHGVEVGLDSNGRKNRGGSIMEDLVEIILKKVYQLDESSYMTQGSPSKAKQLWGIDLPVDKASRRPDFLIRKNQKIIWIEANFFSAGGSKLKSTCGEYKSLFDFCRTNNIEFIWITDGAGWKTTLKPLEETFEHINYIFNLGMLKDEILKDLWS